MSPELCYATGIVLAGIAGAVMAPSLAKEHGWRRVLPWTIVSVLVVGVAIGWGLVGEFNLISISRGEPPQ